MRREPDSLPPSDRPVSLAEPGLVKWWTPAPTTSPAPAARTGPQIVRKKAASSTSLNS
jgi:hypothetical protein